MFGFGKERIIGNDFLIDLRGEAVGTDGGPVVTIRSLARLSDAATTADRIDVAALKRRYDDLYGVAWWRIVRGSAVSGL